MFGISVVIDSFETKFRKATNIAFDNDSNNNTNKVVAFFHSDFKHDRFESAPLSN